MRRFTVAPVCGALALMAALFAAPVRAADGTWNVPGFGDWDTASNWVGNTIADGVGSTANFTQPDLSTSGTQVTIGAPRTIGNLVFADANPATGAGLNWELFGSELTLAGGTPTITVNAMNPGGAAIINVALAGTAGFTKAGAGQLTLGVFGAHTITGGINVNGGTLRVDDGVTLPAQNIAIRNGATLSVPAGIGTAAAPLNIPEGATAHLVTRNGAANGGNTSAGLGGGAGSTLHVTTETDGGTISADGNWATGGSVRNLNVTGVAGGLPEYFRLRVNGGSFAAASLEGTAVHLDEVVLFTRTNSGGNTVSLGALSGTASAVLSGGGGGAFGGSGTGSFVTYNIGALNTDTTFAGTIDVASAMPDTSNGALLGGININKVGTGTLTLSGNLAYQPTMNTTANRRSGITTVTAGTLKLTGSAAIPGGVTDGFTNFVSTVRILAGGTLDVSTTATPYSTAPLQQVIGAGRIVGNYTHDEGLLAPGDTLSGTTPTAVAAAGTLTFENNLSFNGSGTVRFDVSPSLTSGNDKIQVNGQTTLTGTPTINFGFLGGFTTGTYTLLESTGGFVGNTSGWNVNWPGRGAAPPIVTAGNQLQITVGAGNVGSVTWSGADPGFDNSWVSGAAGPLNWHNNNTNAADRFFDLDAVTFGDAYGPSNTPVTNATIALNTTVQPLDMNFTSNTVDYSIIGGGQISGPASLTKSGSSTLTLQTANSFNGPVAISAGTVDIGNFVGALGTGALTISNATLAVANGSNGTLTNASITLPGGSTTIVTDAGGSLALPSISGSGDLSIVTNAATKNHDLPTGISGFTGNLTVGTPGTPNTAIVRTGGGGGSSLPNTLVTLNGASSLRDRATSAQTVTLGGLQGEAAATLYGYQGGSGATQRTWAIGALNLDTTFEGTIVDGQGSGATVAATHITKIGTGTLTLTGLNTYTGNTAVNGGVLSITQPYLSDTGNVLLSGGMLNLDTSGQFDLINALFLNGMSQQPGVYGAVGSGAQFETPLITGSGRLQVQTFVLQGDFDGNGVVDSLDLDAWKAAAVANTAAADADFDGDTDGNDFLIWQRNLGRTNPVAPVAGAVPEPGSLALAAAALVALASTRRRRSA